MSGNNRFCIETSALEISREKKPGNVEYTRLSHSSVEGKKLQIIRRERDYLRTIGFLSRASHTCDNPEK